MSSMFGVAIVRMVRLSDTVVNGDGRVPVTATTLR